MRSPESSQHRHSTQRSLTAALLVVLAAAAFFRGYRLLSLFPILVDESIYLRWAEIIDHEGQWFVSLLDAKQPLSYWIYAALRKAAPWLDPLLGARLVSVCAGVLSVGISFVLGRRLGGTLAGIATALFTALLPFGAFYDRLAYTDALVNLAGLGITAASIACFQSGRPGRRPALATGLALGLGFFVKATAALFAAVPLFAAALWSWHQKRIAVTRLAQAYGVALLFPVVSYFLVPEGPTFEVNSLLVHHTSFFTPLSELAANPTVNLPRNVPLVAGYLASYATVPFAIAALASILYLASTRNRVIWLAVPLLVGPLTIEICTLQYFPSRYVYPHAWPLALLTALALAGATRRISHRAVPALSVVALATPLAIASARLVIVPEAQLHRSDFVEFLSSGPFSGFGIREAVAYLRKESAAGPITILTDPIWGPPADAIYPYLNLRYGILVYDAWWMQLPGRQPILPRAPMEVMKSQYERVSAGVVDFLRLERVYYVTDTNYHTPEDVRWREPGARLAARFPKRNGLDSIDVYRLR